MQITFITTRRISEDGFVTGVYEEGETYDIADTAAALAIRNGWAIEKRRIINHWRAPSAARIEQMERELA